MTAITGARNQIQQEEVDFNSSVSEATLTRIGASINFINDHVVTRVQFGKAGTAYADTDIGTREQVPVDAEISYIGVQWNDSGSSGTTTMDVHLIRGGSDQGTIFSTKPAVSSAASNNGSFVRDFVDSVTAGTTTNVTIPVLSTTNLNQGDVLRFDFDAAAPGATDVILTLAWRPR